jgi:hypothetical protein
MRVFVTGYYIINHYKVLNGPSFVSLFTEHKHCSFLFYIKVKFSEQNAEHLSKLQKQMRKLRKSFVLSREGMVQYRERLKRGKKILLFNRKIRFLAMF